MLPKQIEPVKRHDFRQIIEECKNIIDLDHTAIDYPFEDRIRTVESRLSSNASKTISQYESTMKQRKNRNQGTQKVVSFNDPQHHFAVQNSRQVNVTQNGPVQKHYGVRDDPLVSFETQELKLNFTAQQEPFSFKNTLTDKAEVRRASSHLDQRYMAEDKRGSTRSRNEEQAMKLSKSVDELLPQPLRFKPQKKAFTSKVEPFPLQMTPMYSR